MAEQACILVIEKDEAFATKVAAALAESGFEVARASDAMSGVNRLYEAHPDLVIMARDLPMVKGEDPFIWFRQASDVLIIVVGPQEEMAEILESGADAYMTSPPSLIELVAKVRSMLRRKPRYHLLGDNPKLEIENRLPKEGNGLTPTEFRLASCLLLNKGRLLGYPQLISEVWGGKEVSLDTLHFYVRQLHSKLADAGIFGLRGTGCCFSGNTFTAAAWEIPATDVEIDTPPSVRD